MAIHTIADITGDGAVHQLSATSIKANWVNIQAVGALATTARVGDANISSTRGIPIGSNGFFFAPTAANTNNYDLNSIWYLVGSGDKIAVAYNVD